MLDILLFGFIMLFGFMIMVFITGVILLNSLIKRIVRLCEMRINRRKDDYYIDLKS